MKIPFPTHATCDDTAMQRCQHRATRLLGAMRLCDRDQTRKTSGVVVSGVVPGGEVSSKVPESRSVTGRTGTAPSTCRGDFAMVSARSAAVVAACGTTPACARQSCCDGPLRWGPVDGSEGSSHVCPEPWWPAAAPDADSHTITQTVPETGTPARTVRRTTAILCRQHTDRVYRGTSGRRHSHAWRHSVDFSPSTRTFGIHDSRRPRPSLGSYLATCVTPAVFACSLNAVMT